SYYVLYLYFFFFSSRRRHTRFSRDWSSDVCSSDLVFAAGAGTQFIQPTGNGGTGKGLQKTVFQQGAGKPGGFTGQGIGHIAADGQYPLRLLLLLFRQLCP